MIARPFARAAESAGVARRPLWSTLMKYAVLLLFAALPLWAQEHCGMVMMSLAGSGQSLSSADAVATGWKMSQAYAKVTISVSLDSAGYDDYFIATAYLVRQLGPGTTRNQEISESRFEVPPSYQGEFVLFENLNLAPGEYWLVFDRPPYAERGEKEWNLSTFEHMTVATGITFLGSKAYSYVNHRTDYLPDATYITTDGLQGYPVLITGIPLYFGVR
jgi:hypothetical protein